MGRPSLRERSSRSLGDLHLSPNHEFEFLFAVLRGSQDLACEKKVKDGGMLDFWPYKDVWRAQSDFLSGDRALYNLRCAEHRRNRRWGSSLRRLTTKRHINDDENIRKTKQQIVWQKNYSPPSMSSLSEIRLGETIREWPSDRLLPVSTAPRPMQSCCDQDNSSPR